MIQKINQTIHEQQVYEYQQKHLANTRLNAGKIIDQYNETFAKYKKLKRQANNFLMAERAVMRPKKLNKLNHSVENFP